jgi:Ca-activated chloride channel family protein
MSFDSPAGLWLLGAIPVIVTLWLLRPRRPRMRIPSVMLWPTSLAERQSARPWQRLRNHPLLWLQLLIAVLLALAAARPFVPAEAAEQRVIVLLDGSGSMRARDVSPSRWDAARAAVVELAAGLGPDQKLSVVRADDQPRVLVADTRDSNRVDRVLSAEEPAYGPIDGPTTISLAAGLAQGSPSEWVLVGDGQFPDVPNGVPQAQTTETVRPWISAAAWPAETRFRFLRIGSADAGNVAVTGLTLRPNGNAFALQVGVRNASNADASGTLQLVTDSGSVVAVSDWSAAAHQDAYIAWDGVQPGPRWFEARLTNVVPPSANTLDVDDRAWAVPDLSATTEQRALLVTPGNTFLERVVAVEGNLRTFKVSPTDWAALVAQGDSAQYALVVLDRQPRDTTPTPRGSTLFIGLPGSSDDFQPRFIAPVPDHPLLRNVDWSEVRILRAGRLVGPDWETVVDSDGGPLVAVRTVREEGPPARVRREAMLTFELGQSDLALRPAFPVLMANLLEWLAPRAEGRMQVVAPGGAVQVLASPLARSVRVLSLLGGSSVVEELAPPWPPRSFHPPAPGVYQVVSDNPDGPAVSYVVADAFAPSEADLSVVEPAGFAAHAVQGSDIGQVLNSVRAGVWPWLLAALLVLATAEWLVDARGK